MIFRQIFHQRQKIVNPIFSCSIFQDELFKKNKSRQKIVPTIFSCSIFQDELFKKNKSRQKIVNPIFSCSIFTFFSSTGLNCSKNKSMKYLDDKGEEVA